VRADLIERVLPQSGLRQWVLTFPFSWRRRLAQDGALLGRLTRILAETVHAFYAEGAAKEGISGAKTGSVTVVQRTSSDLRLNPHLHLVALDGAYHEQGAELAWQALGHLKTSEVGEGLGRAVRRMEKQLRRRGLLVDESGAEAGAEGDADPERQAATRAGALDQAGREALLRYVLRPPIAQERLERRPDGLVRITLKKAYSDGKVAVDMDPLSLLCRLATSVPQGWFHTVRYGGVLASAMPVEIAHRAEAAPGSTRGQRRVRDAEARRGIPPVGGASGTHLRGGRARLSQVPGAPEAARDGHRPREHRPLPRRGGRGDRGAAPRRAAARRTGRAASLAGRRSVRGTDVTAAGETRRRRGGARARCGPRRGAVCALRDRRDGALPRAGAATCRGAIGVAKCRGRRVRDVCKDGC
jgi:hypothetical protein